jgi:hypothetical protein
VAASSLPEKPANTTTANTPPAAMAGAHRFNGDGDGGGGRRGGWAGGRLFTVLRDCWRVESTNGSAWGQVRGDDGA